MVHKYKDDMENLRGCGNYVVQLAPFGIECVVTMS